MNVKKTAARSSDLTAAEAQHCRTALRFLHRRCETWAPLAAALRVKDANLSEVARGNRPVTASLAFRIARFAKVTVDDVVTGRFPDPRACPMCGHVAEEAEAAE